MSIKGKNVGQINPFFKCDTELDAGTFVTVDTDNEDEVIAADGNSPDKVIGVLAQDVVAKDVDVWKLDSITAKARKGEKVGIYMNGGIYEIDQTDASVSQGDYLYHSNSNPGQVNADDDKDDSDASKDPVAIAEEDAEAGEMVRIKLLV